MPVIILSAIYIINSDSPHGPGNRKRYLYKYLRLYTQHAESVAYYAAFWLKYKSQWKQDKPEFQ